MRGIGPIGPGRIGPSVGAGLGPQVRGFMGQPGIGGRPGGPVGPLGVSGMRGFVGQRGPLGPSQSIRGLGTGTRVNQFRNGPGSQTFRGLTGQFGRPNHSFSFLPRTGRNGWEGRQGNREWNNWNRNHGNRNDQFFRRDRDRFFRNRFRNNFIDNDFFFPWYFAAPFWGAFWYPGYYPSVYSYWGWTPGWIQPTEAYYQPLYTYGEEYPAYQTYNYYYPNYPTVPEGAAPGEGQVAEAPPVPAPGPQVAVDSAGSDGDAGGHPKWVAERKD